MSALCLLTSVIYILKHANPWRLVFIAKPSTVG